MDVDNMPQSPLHEITREALNKIHEICDTFRIISLNRLLEACEGLLTQNPLIDVAVLGQFKAGKSSFLNSMIDKPILPIGVTPVTTVITRLQYGPKERGIITLFDGVIHEIDLSMIQDFTSEARNPANQKNVEVVDIELPSLKDYGG